MNEVITLARVYGLAPSRGLHTRHDVPGEDTNCGKPCVLYGAVCLTYRHGHLDLLVLYGAVCRTYRHGHLERPVLRSMPHVQAWTSGAPEI